MNEIWYFANKWVVRFLYPLPVSPNHITLLALVFGIASTICYLIPGNTALMWAGGFLYAKLLFDNVDGNLARIREEESRLGRFYDSVSDFLVTFLVYAVIAIRLVRETGDGLWIVWSGAALFFTLIHCSYFVYYLVHYTTRVGSYQKNRVDETPTAEEQSLYQRGQLPKKAYFFQMLYNRIYGWQDRLILLLDRRSSKQAGLDESSKAQELWFMDKPFLVLAAPLCLCTNIMWLVLCTFAGRLDIGLIGVVTFWNIYMLGLHVWKVLRYRRRFSCG